MSNYCNSVSDVCFVTFVSQFILSVCAFLMLYWVIVTAEVKRAFLSFCNSLLLSFCSVNFIKYRKTFIKKEAKNLNKLTKNTFPLSRKALSHFHHAHFSIHSLEELSPVSILSLRSLRKEVQRSKRSYGNHFPAIAAIAATMIAIILEPCFRESSCVLFQLDNLTGK